jgi:hypothetical protein
VWTSIEVHEHRGIAARGNNPICGRSFLELVAPEQFYSFATLDAVFSIKDVCGAPIGIANGAGVWQRFDLITSLLAVFAIAHTAHDRPAERFEFDATACARCGHDG